MEQSEQAEQTIDAVINGAFAPVSDLIATIVFYEVNVFGVDLKLILIWLVLAGLYFTITSKFANLRYFKHSIDIVRGKFDTDGESDGEISRFQALATSLSGTIGLGNIAGVAVAISVGGPGAMVWMIIMGLFGMMTKFTEVTLGVKYRHHHNTDNPDSLSGGPMYYLRDGFANKNIPYIGTILSIGFALLCILGTIGAGPLFQTNQAYEQFVTVTGGENSFLADKGWVFGLGMAILVGLVVIGGIKSIGRVASKVVPIMGAVYLLAAIVVVALHASQVPQAMVTIFKDAFDIQAGFGALMGTILMGVQRAAFSNEAGLGTAAIAHSSCKTNDPISQGFVGMLGPFVDTIVVCTATALVIVVTGAYQGSEGMEGVELTSRAFEQGIEWFPYILALTVFLFAYSTLLAWIYYGVKAFTFIVGENKYTVIGFKLFLLLFVIVGASSNLASVIDFTDAVVLAMSIPNLIGLYWLSGEVRTDMKEYINRIKNSKSDS